MGDRLHCKIAIYFIDKIYNSNHWKDIQILEIFLEDEKYHNLTMELCMYNYCREETVKRQRRYVVEFWS